MPSTIYGYKIIMKSILFICTGNYYRSRFAEEYFNHITVQKKILWRAKSRGLYQDLSFLQNVGSISVYALQELNRYGIELKNKDKWPISITYDDFSQFDHYIAMDQEEHQPMIQSLFPNIKNDIEYWDIKDIGFEDPASACERIVQNVDGLIDRLISSNT